MLITSNQYQGNVHMKLPGSRVLEEVLHFKTFTLFHTSVNHSCGMHMNGSPLLVYTYQMHNTLPLKPV